MVWFDLRGSPQVSEPRVGGRSQTVDGAVGSGLEGMGGTVWPVVHRLCSEMRQEKEETMRIIISLLLCVETGC